MATSGRWRPSSHWSRPEARVLTDVDLPAALAICAQDPVESVLVATRLEAGLRLGLRSTGGQLWGFPALGPIESICWAGANLVPVLRGDEAGRREAVDAFAGLARRFGRRCSSIVGERAGALALWDVLSEHWPAAREVRADQPSLMIDREPDVAPDLSVRRSLPEELSIVLPACVRMFIEEVGYSPVGGGSTAYEDRVRSLVQDGRSFISTTEGVAGPEVVFKAELGAVSEHVAQVQGVWVEPMHRGRRLSESGMAAVVQAARAQVAPVVSLYVNAYNSRALAAYRRVGFEQVGTFATILF